MIPKWRFMLSRSFSRLTLINNYYMRALTNHFSVRDLGIFPVWTLPETEINNFNDFTNSFRTKINLQSSCLQNRLFSLTLKFLKDQDSFKHILRPLKPTETFHNTHFSSFYPFSVKKGFAYGEAVSAKCYSQDDSFNNPKLRQKILDAL